MAVKDRSNTSRTTVAHFVESITHHSVSARTIRRHYSVCLQNIYLAFYRRLRTTNVSAANSAIRKKEDVGGRME
ncbi:hypothetical protein TNCV_5052641 [Trichonephila clavipes]|nr:hypothetical protein TNCV_5052641 [Trichonephila clavipes]